MLVAIADTEQMVEQDPYVCGARVRKGVLSLLPAKERTSFDIVHR